MDKENKYNSDNKYYNELDLKFTAKVIKSSLSIMQTKISVNHLIDPLAKLVFSLAVKNVNEKGIFIQEDDLRVLVDDSERLDKFKAFNYPFEVTSVIDLIKYINTFNVDSPISSMESAILERYTRNSLFKIKNSLDYDLKDSTKSVKALLRQYSHALDSLMFGTSETRKIVTSHDIIKQEKDHINSPAIKTFPTTGIIIDEVNGGLNAPSTTYVCGKPKSGKSIALYNIACNSLKIGRTVLFGTIEIPAEDALRKMICCYYDLDYDAINKKTASQEELLEYIKYAEAFAEETKDKIYIIDDDDGLCCKDFETYYFQMEKAGIKIDDIICDYTLIMKSNNPKLNKLDSLASIPVEARQLSKKTGTRFFSACQLHERDKELEDINIDDIYYMKTISHECTYLLAIDGHKDFANIFHYKMKFLPSRQSWDSNIYKYQDISQHSMKLYEPTIYTGKSKDDYNSSSDDNEEEIYNW